jgi:GcrA cell cycle regulator
MGNSTDNRWSDEEKVVVEQMWKDGFSASQIATKVNTVFATGRSRNSVIGISHRAGFSAATRNNAFDPRADRPQVPKAPRPVKPAPVRSDLRRVTKPAFAVVVTPPPAPESPRELPGLATIHTLGPHMCKWPIGEPGAADFTFCGEARNGDDAAYCPRHRAIGGGGRIEPKKADITRMARYAR